MTTDQQQDAREFIIRNWPYHRYRCRRHWLFFWRSAPQELTPDQVELFLDQYFDLAYANRAACADEHEYEPMREFLLKQQGKPVGFDPITWFIIAKVIIELLLLWFRFSKRS